MTPQKPVHGPTVAEAARAELIKIEEQISDLQMKRRIVQRRLEQFGNSTMLEAERIATHAEAFLPPLFGGL